MRPLILRTLELAEKGRGSCAPNPAVGAVLVRDGVVVGEGYHRGPGQPHAEVEAIRGNEEAARGATLVVSLEPCCHFGRTPPCTDLLKQVGIARVVYAFGDPNPVVAGRGREALLAAGIACEQVEIPEANEFYRSYAHWWKTGRPYITAKLALSLDGRIAGEGGMPVALTGEEAQKFTHTQRLRSDALLTSLKTVRTDNPQLNVRLATEPVSKPVYVVGRGVFPGGAKLFSTAQKIVWIAGGDSPLAPEGVEIWTDSLEQSLLKLGKQCHDLWVEAGGTLFQSLWESGLTDRAFLYVAPKWLGEGGLAAFSKEFKGFPPPSAKVVWRTAGADAICEVVR